jgi:hypothetical protein
VIARANQPAAENLRNLSYFKFFVNLSVDGRPDVRLGPSSTMQNGLVVSGSGWSLVGALSVHDDLGATARTIPV